MDIVFATVTPVNKDAQDNIARAWTESRQKHHEGFLYRVDTPQQPGFSHFYGLRLGQRQNVRDGWVIGCANWEAGDLIGGVDLLVSADRCINPTHAALNFDEHGRFFIEARYGGVEVDGELLIPHQPRILENTAHLKFGPLSYRFQFAVDDSAEEAFQDEKSRYLVQAKISAESPNPITSATPSKHGTKICGWIVHGAIGTASDDSLVLAATNPRTGHLVAVKTSSRADDYQARCAAREIDVYRELKALKDHRDGAYVMVLYDLLFESGSEDWPGHFDRVFMLWEPLGRDTFEEFEEEGMRCDLPNSIRLALFIQVAKAVRAIHEYGWLHNDIKPDNIYIVSIEPPHAILGDYGLACPETDHPTGEWGTEGWAPPEMYGQGDRSAHDETAGLAFSYPADIFSLGAVGLFLFNDGKPSWPTETENIFEFLASGYALYAETLHLLSEEVDKPLPLLLGQMLHQDPDQRPTIHEVVDQLTQMPDDAADQPWSDLPIVD